MDDFEADLNDENYVIDNGLVYQNGNKIYYYNNADYLASDGDSQDGQGGDQNGRHSNRSYGNNNRSSAYHDLGLGGPRRQDKQAVDWTCFIDDEMQLARIYEVSDIT